MNAPLLARPADPAALRRQIDALEAEINAARGKRDNVIKAIAERRQKLNRLKAQLAFCEPGVTLSRPELCPA